MKLEVGELKLFGVDLNRVLRWWWQGLRTGHAGELINSFLKPSPRLRVTADDTWLGFHQPDSDGAPELARLAIGSHAGARDNDLRAALLPAGVREDLLQVELLLPAQHVLRRRLSLPAEVANNLQEVLGYQVSRLTPFPPDKLYYDVAVIGESTSGDQFEVELLAAPRAYVDPLLEQIESASGLRVSRLTVEGNEQANLFGAQRVPGRWWRRLNLNSWLLIGVLFALLLAAVAPVLKERQLVIERKQAIALLQAEVQGLAAVKETLEHDLDGLTQMVNRRVSLPSPDRVIAEVTRLLPDETYLTAFNIQKNVLTLNGIGKDAVDLIPALNASELFESARFASPVSRNAGTGLDQFVITSFLVTTAQGADE